MWKLKGPTWGAEVLQKQKNSDMEGKGEQAGESEHKRPEPAAVSDEDDLRKQNWIWEGGLNR